MQPKPQKVATEKPPICATESLDKKLAEAVEENEELTAQQKDFCLYFSRIRNATQAYFKAYNCSYESAKVNGHRLLTNANIQEELKRLREIKVAALGEFCGEDVIELHMRIAFADITDFVEFKGKTVPVTYKGDVITMEHPKTGELIPVTQTINEVKLKDSNQVDGQLISEVSEGSNGVKIKRVDQQRSLAFLERYFELNPMDEHRKEYDRRRLELEGKKVNALLNKNKEDKPNKNDDSIQAKNKVIFYLPDNRRDVSDDNN